MTAPLLQTSDLNVFYGQLQAVHGVNFVINAGEIVSIIGANGAGKSSFLRAIVGQSAGFSGQIQSEDKNLADMQTPDIVKHGIALVPEGRKLFSSLTVAENLNIGWELGRGGSIDVAQIYAWFPALKEIEARQARALSGGQQQMVALGRALLTNPKLLLCDEISLGLAPVIVNQLYETLGAIRARGISIVIVEQDVGRALAISDRFYCFLEGEVSLEGRPVEHSRDTIMQHYFGV